MIRALRKAAGADYPPILRVAGSQFMPGGYGLDKTIQFCRLTVSCGIDAIDVTGGWHETVIPQLPADVPAGGYVYLAEHINGAVDVPHAGG